MLSDRTTRVSAVGFLIIGRDAPGRRVENYVSQHAALGCGGGAAGGTKLSFLGIKKNREKESKP